MIKKFLTVAALIVASTVMSIAQTRTIEHDYSEFDSIVASNGFHVSLSESDSYSTKIVVDDALESYVQCYVKAKTLYISIDEKSVPKDIKKSYKGKNTADPVLNAVVYMPKLKALTLNSDASFTTNGPLEADKFALSLSDGCSATGLQIVANSAVVNASKKAKLSGLKVSADDVEINADGNAVISMEHASKNLNVTNSGSAELTIVGDCNDVKVTSNGSAKTLLSGKADSFKASGKGNSAKVDASALSVKDAVLCVTGVSVIVNAADDIELDLGKGAEVEYAGNPDVKIVKIQSASVTRK